MTYQPSKRRWTDGRILLLVWLVSTAIIAIWLWLDHTPPAWDQGDHLSRAMKHWQMLRSPEWLSGEWWRSLWMKAPTQRAPLTYLLTALVFNIFGTGFDQAIYVNFLFTAILLGSTYAIGRRVFSSAVGLWAAGACLLSPVLVDLQKDYLLDYPMTAMVAFMYMGMTYFWLAEKSRTRWLTIPLWGVGLGLMLMTRTSGLLFAIPPVGWMLSASVFQRQWLRLAQAIVGIAIGVMTLWPWFSTNWLTVISTTLSSTSHGVIYRGDPQANTLSGWLFYPEQLPQLLSWPLFGLGAIALTVILIRALINRTLLTSSATSEPILRPQPAETRRGWIWLSVFIVGTYILFSLGSYKALRVFVPFLPIFWVAIAQGILSIKIRGWRFLRWLTVGIALVLALHQLFWSRTFTSTQAGTTTFWPNEAVVSEMTETTPFLKSTLGLVTNTAEINAYNMAFYGAVKNYQVFARQLSFNSETAIQDSQVLDWYLTKTGEQGAYDTIEEGQQKLREAVETSPDLAVQRVWTLPDNSELTLHHRQNPPITVTPVDSQLDSQREQRILLSVDTIASISAGNTYPITYRVTGSGAALQSGLLLLTWEPESQSQSSAAQPLTSQPPASQPVWISDHGIGLGYLNTDVEMPSGTPRFEVIETLSITPPKGLTTGRYRLRAEYLNRESKEHYVISENAAQIQVVAAAPPPVQAGFQELLTYLHTDLSPKLRQGELDPLFDEVGRINQYEPLQDYLPQAEQAMTYRLSQQPNNVDWLYTLALSQVLQQKPSAATDTLRALTAVDAGNPYSWAYLGFLHLYQWQPQQASTVLSEAEKRQPDLPNLKLLQGVNAAMKLNIPKAVRLIKEEI